MNVGEKSEIYVKLFLLRNKVLPIYNINGKFITDDRYNIREIDERIKFKKEEIILDNNIEIAQEEIGFLLQDVVSSLRNQRDIDYKALKYFSKQKSTKKEDISILVDDNIKNISEILLKYSIKSYFKSNPTLINSSQHTNIRYELKDCTDEMMNAINNISSKKKLLDRYSFCNDNNLEIIYDSIISETFFENLKMVDSTFPQLLGEKLLESYSGETKNFKDLIKEKMEVFQFIRFIEYFGLSAFPSKKWDGKIVVNGGFIEVEKDLTIKVLDLVYDKENILNNMFENLKFDSPSTSRYKMFEVFKEGNKYYFTLNVQIRYR